MLRALTWDPLLVVAVAKTFFFVGIPIGINHQSIGTEVSQAILLNVARLLAETANNSFGFTIVSIFIEAVEIGLEWWFPLSDSLEHFFGELLIFCSNRHVTGGGSRGDISNSATLLS